MILHTLPLRKHMLDFTLRRVDHNTFDCFFGTQWGTWSRVRKGRSSTYRVAGEHLAKAALKELDLVLDTRMPINYNQSPYQTLANCVAIQESR